jgi:hypothetical protein
MQRAATAKASVEILGKQPAKPKFDKRTSSDIDLEDQEQPDHNSECPWYCRFSASTEWFEAEPMLPSFDVLEDLARTLLWCLASWALIVYCATAIEVRTGHHSLIFIVELVCYIHICLAAAAIVGRCILRNSPEALSLPQHLPTSLCLGGVFFAKDICTFALLLGYSSPCSFFLIAPASVISEAIMNCETPPMFLSFCSAAITFLLVFMVPSEPTAWAFNFAFCTCLYASLSSKLLEDVRAELSANEHFNKMDWKLQVGIIANRIFSFRQLSSGFFALITLGILHRLHVGSVEHLSPTLFHLLPIAGLVVCRFQSDCFSLVLLSLHQAFAAVNAEMIVLAIAVYSLRMHLPTEPEPLQMVLVAYIGFLLVGVHKQCFAMRYRTTLGQLLVYCVYFVRISTAVVIACIGRQVLAVASMIAPSKIVFYSYPNPTVKIPGCQLGLAICALPPTEDSETEPAAYNLNIGHFDRKGNDWLETSVSTTNMLHE